MKKIIYVILLLTTLNLFSESFYDNLELKRVSSNYNGSAYNKKAILVYGNGGIIVRSIDGGKNWEQINLNDSLNILKIVSFNNIFYGISNRNYIIFSDDVGKVWNYKNFGNSTELINLFENNEYLFLILNNRIVKLNKELEIEKEYSYTLDTSYYSIEMIDNKIIYSQGKGKLGFINIDNDEAGTIDLSELGICDSCSVPKEIFSNRQDLLYFFINDELHQINVITNKVKQVYKPLYKENSAFCAFGQDVFQLYNISDKTKNLDSLYFVKVDKENNTLIHIKLSGNDRYISNLLFTHLQFISQDTIIAVGRGKLIYMSYDGGRNWELKSLLNQFSYLFLTDSQNAFILAPFAQIFHTNNEGDTWLTQKNYDEVFYKNPSFKLPLHFSTLRFVKGQKGLYIATSSYDTSKRFIYSIDNGETIDFKNIRIQNWVPSSGVYPFILNCYDKILIFTHRKIKPLPMTLYIDRLNNDSNIEKSYTLQEKVFYAVYNLNDTIVAIEKDYDTLNPNSNKYNVYISNDTANSWKISFSFEVDNDVYHHHIYTSSQVNNFIFFNWSFLKILHNDTISYSKLYLLDIHKHSFIELNQDNAFFYKVFYFNGKFNIIKRIYNTESNEFLIKFIYKEDIEDFTSVWRKYRCYRFSPPLINITEDNRLPFTTILSDTMFAFVAYDSLFNEEALFFAKTRLPTSVEENYQIESETPIYITSPVPTPAHTFAKMKIYWDYWLNIDQAEFTVINLLGLEVSHKEDFQFTRINSYSGELIWRPQGLSPGVYIIIVRIGNKSSSKVIVLD